jgi:hypothetical protein
MPDGDHQHEQLRSALLLALANWLFHCRCHNKFAALSDQTLSLIRWERRQGCLFMVISSTMF